MIRWSARLPVPLLAAILITIAAVVAVTARHPAEPGVRVAAGSRTVAVQLADMRIVPAMITVPAGTRLTLQVTDVDQLQHDLAIEGGPRTPLLDHDQEATLQLGTVSRDLQGWCTVPGHRAAGMTITIAVTGGTRSAEPAPKAPGPAPRIEVAATPPPGWKPYDPVLPAASPRTVHRVTLVVEDVSTEVAPGVRQERWTYNGTAPGPTLHGRVGDRFIITVINRGDMTHSIDFHAGSVSPDGPTRAIPPGGSLRYTFTAGFSGAWLYHCSTMPMSLHIANGMYGAVIIDPPDLDQVADQFVIIQSELYLGRNGGTADENKINTRQPDAVVFNGYSDQYRYAPIRVPAGDRIRVWVVDAGPEFGTSFHVVGSQFTAVFKEGAYLLRPGNPEHGAAQALDLAPGQGGFVEFTLPAAGHYAFVDHAMTDAEHGATGVFLAR